MNSRSRFRFRALAKPDIAAVAAILLFQSLAAPAEDRVLRVIGDENYPPYLFLNADGEEDGFLVDLWTLWERKTGAKVALKATKWDEAQRILLRGDADVIENIFETPRRQPLYDFSKPYADLPVAIYRDVSIGGLTNLDSLRGFEVGVMEGDACIEHLKTNGINSLVYYGNYTKLIQGAKAQDIKVFCLDEYPANFYLYRQGVHRQFVEAFALYHGQFHRAVRKGDLATLRLVEQGMDAISPDEMAALRRKWFSEPIDYARYTRHVLEAAAALALGLALLGLWIVSLRRAVAARTAERTLAEQALIDSEARLRSLGDNLPNGFVYQYEVAQGLPRFRYLSAGVEITLGHAPEDLRANAKLFFDLIPSAALADYAAAETKSAEALSDFSILLPFDRRDGQRRWLLAQSRPRRTAEGILWDGVALDVTEQRESEIRLRESELRFRRLFEESKEAMTLVEDGRFIDANRATLDMMRMTRVEQLRGVAPAEISPERQPDGQLSTAKAEAVIREALESGSNQFEWEHMRADGEHFFAEVLVTAMNVGERQLLHVVWRDITGRKHAEAELDRYRRNLEVLVAERTAALQESNDQLAHTQFAMDRAGIGIAWNHADTGQFLYANEELCRQLGHGCGELLGLTLSDINTHLSRPELSEVAADLRRGSGVTRLETIHRRKNGSSYPASVTVYLHHAADEEWLIGFIEDITARKAAEAELILARDAAEAANRAKSAFLANMSHEIRTPLNAIAGMAYLVRNAGVTAEQQAWLDTLDRASRHLLDIINAMLDVAKIDAGKLQLDCIPVSIESVVANVVELIAPHAKSKGLQMITEVEPPSLPLVGDPTLLQQALLNYAANAVKFTTAGSVTLRVRSIEQGRETVVLRFEVQDTGIGIAPDTIVRLFADFEQVDNSNTRAFGGTGLGLSITRRLVQLMGGEVGVSSTLGMGSRFWFTVPLAVRLTLPEENAEDHAAAHAAVLISRDFVGARVLLVDDDEVNQQVAQLLLEDVGLLVDVAGDGREASALAAENAYALILMDMRMPVMDGPEATRRIRELPRHERTPIIAMTANVFAEDRSRCREAGMDDFLSKPVDPDTLYATLFKWLSVSVHP